MTDWIESEAGLSPATISRLLDLEPPWVVTDLEVFHEQAMVKVHIGHDGSEGLVCPHCGAVSAGYDQRYRQWRHLDTMEYRTYLSCEVPRIECAEHGVMTVEVPWAEPRSRYTARFEALVIDWLRESSTAAVSRVLRLSWNAIDGIKQRAVRRGLSRREACKLDQICVDETAFKKRHNYVTVVSDHVGGTVIHVGEDRKKKTLKQWYHSLSKAQLKSISSVSMDMWPAFINATLEAVPGAQRKIAFDKFHVAKYLTEAVDKVRRQEHKELLQVGVDDLKGTKYDWLKNRANMTHQQKLRFKVLRDSSLKTARAWAIKELAMSLWDYVSRTWADKAWKRWLSWAMRCRLEPVKKAARTIKAHLWGILNAVVLDVSNGPAESLNSRIKMIKAKSRGYRNKQRFINDIYFHLGGLDLYPEGVKN